jgi:uncharacterized 2Fe-2S/4Fe-4S cluster protein (DUF4445 family)
MDGHLHPVEFQPSGRRANCPEGTTLLEAARQANLPLSSTCGGKGTCGKCRVKAGGHLSPLTAEESARLGPADLQAGYRLACQARVLGSCVIQVHSADTVVYKAAVRELGFPVELVPDTRKIRLRLPRPSLMDQRSDLDRLCTTLGVPCDEVDLAALRHLPAALRTADWAVTGVLTGGRLIAVEVGDTRAESYGIAVDLGTTTAAAYLASLASGQLLSAAIATNRQAIYGDDVISRLDYAHTGGLGELRRAALETLNSLVEELCQQSQVAPQHIYEAAVVGNTCMMQLLLGIDPHPIGVAPYVPAVVEAMELPAREVGLAIAEGGRVHVLPGVAGYVGADAVADVLAASQREPDRVRLIMDVGTNAEIVLDNRGQLLACAAAAGPAFEGARISCGMRAAPGAIDRTRVIDGRLEVHALENRPPLGLAGSGLVSVAAALRRSGLLTSRGRFVPTAAPGLFANDGNGMELVLAPAERSGTGQVITLSQRDIAELLLAKAAIAAGMKVLLQEAGLTVDDLDEVLVAGSFGSFVDQEEAMDIGLVPRLPLERIVGVGNAAGSGAILALLSLDMRRQAQEVARRITYIELSARPEFNQEFVQGMSFPEIDRAEGG